MNIRFAIDMNTIIDRKRIAGSAENGELGHGSLRFDEVLVLKPLRRFIGVAANEENFLNGSRAEIEAFKACRGFVLEFEAEFGRLFAAADFDPAGNDARDIGALFDDAVEDCIQSRDAAMLTFDASELHIAIGGLEWI
jgi:hypothetical protein